MPGSEEQSQHGGHLYSVYFAPRGFERMARFGNKIAQLFLSPFDKVVGLVSPAGSGKSMLIKGMFPGLELTNDDDGVNVRPLPLLDVEDDETGFYSSHTYHVDINFEAGFTQMHVLAECVNEAVKRGKRVVIEHFDMIYPALGRNADLLIGIGEEIIITRPTIFGPEPQDIAGIVVKSQPIRRMTHTAEDLTEYIMRKHGLSGRFIHSDVRHGFVFSFAERPVLDCSLDDIENEVNDTINKGMNVSFVDDLHIKFGDDIWTCHGPRMHVRNTNEIKKYSLLKDYIVETDSGRFLLVGTVGEKGEQRISDLNKIVSVD